MPLSPERESFVFVLGFKSLNLCKGLTSTGPAGSGVGQNFDDAAVLLQLYRGLPGRPSEEAFLKVEDFEPALPRLPAEIWELILRKTHSVTACLRWGHVQLAMEIIQDRHHTGQTMMDLAAMEGNIRGIELLSKAELGILNLDLVADYRHLNVLQSLPILGLKEGQQVVCSKDAMNSAAANGDLEILQWLDANRSEGFTHMAFQDAVQFGWRDVVAWLVEVKRVKFSKLHISMAGGNEHHELMLYLLSKYSINGYTLEQEVI